MEFYTLVFPTSTASLTRITTLVDGSETTAIIDSASSVSILNSDLIDDILIKPLQFQVRVVGVTDNTQSVLGWAKINLSFPDSEQVFPLNVYVVSSFKFSLLLGTDFFTKYKVDIDYEDQLVGIQNDMIPMLPLSAVKIPHQISPSNESHCLNTLLQDVNVNNIDEKMLPTSTIVNIDLTEQIILPAYSFKFISIPRPCNLGDINVIQSCDLSDISNHILIPDILLRKEYSDNFQLVVFNITEKDLSVPKGRSIVTIEIFPKLDIEEVNVNNVELGIPQCKYETAHFEAILKCIHPSATYYEREKLGKVLTSFPECFAREGEFSYINCYKHKIQLIEDFKPVRRVPYRKPPHLEEFETKKVEELLQKGIIRPSFSEWSAGTVLVEQGHKSKEGKSIRFCIDYRGLNRNTVKDNFYIGNISSYFDWIGNRSNFMSVIDLEKGFYGVPLDEDSKHLTAFVTNKGLYEFTRLPFGVCNGSSSFSRAMAMVLCGLLWKKCVNFIDDCIFADTNFSVNVNNIQAVLVRFRKYGVKISLKKSEFLSPKIKILGHYVTKNGVEVEPEKTKPIMDIPPPDNRKKLKEFSRQRKLFSEIYSVLCG